jgi:hypothetical protein
VSGPTTDKCIRCRAPLGAAGLSRTGSDTDRQRCSACVAAAEVQTAASARARVHRALRGVLTPGVAVGPFDTRRVCVLGLDLWEAWSDLRVIERDSTGALARKDDPWDGWVLWNALDDLGTRYWGFTTTSGGSDTWVIINVALVPAVRAEARWLRLRASHGGDTSGADVDLGVIQPPRPAATVSSRDVPALDETTCWQCGTRPIHRGRQCRSCSADRIAVAERRDEDIDAHRGLVPLAVAAGDVLGGPLTLLAIETMPHCFALRFHHDIDWAIGGACGGGPGGPGSWSHPTTWGRWEISDDHGTTYIGVDLSSHGSPEGWWAEPTFAPALDPTAQRLTIRLLVGGHHVLDIDLPLDGTAP